MKLTLKTYDIEVDIIWTDSNSVKTFKNFTKEGLTINMNKYCEFEQVGFISYIAIN